MTNTITIPNIDGVELNILSELKINQTEILLKNGGRRTLEYQDVRSNTLSDWLLRIWQRRTLDYANAYR